VIRGTGELFLAKGASAIDGCVLAVLIAVMTAVSRGKAMPARDVNDR
jgi:hypothetical protein